MTIASAFRSEASSFGILFGFTLRLGKILMFLFLFTTFMLFIFAPGEPLFENRFFAALFVLKLVGKTSFDDSLGERDSETVFD